LLGELGVLLVGFLGFLHASFKFLFGLAQAGLASIGAQRAEGSNPVVQG
jgi:hypothetical protein